jgi:O-antigen ligase/polysaccharide polymerase Wzy-like membrane protein
MVKFFSSRKKAGHILTALATPNMSFYVFIAFMTLLFFTGGSARDDVQSLIILRPAAVLFGAYALTCRTSEAWKGRLFPLYAALAVGVLLVFQLIPLPPSIWTELPGRHIFADIANLAGMEQPWRPLTLSPSRTLNSFFSLAIPISAIMLYLNLGERYRKQAIGVIIVLTAISALWAMFQIAGPSRGPLFLYDITNYGTAVGLFANRNHQAVLLVASMLLLSWYGSYNPPKNRHASLQFYGSIATIFVFMPLIFVTGSRAGLLLMIPALAASLLFIYQSRYMAESEAAMGHGRAKTCWYLSPRQWVLAVSIILVVSMAVISIFLSRSLAFDRLLEISNVGELRTKILPILTQMLVDYFPWGTGFGSFEHVYKIYEPVELLSPRYLNQAHNDWLQFPIEGGIVAIAIALACISWFVVEMLKIAQNWRVSRNNKYTALMAASVILIFLAGSITDYPLRTPSLIAVFAIIACFFGDSVKSIQRRQAPET